MMTTLALVVTGVIVLAIAVLIVSFNSGKWFGGHKE